MFALEAKKPRIPVKIDNATLPLMSIDLQVIDLALNFCQIAGETGSPATCVECQSSRKKYALAQQIKVGSSIHLTFEVL